MKPTLEKLWNGNISPCESSGIGDSEIEELVQLLERNKRSLDMELDEYQKKKLEKYLTCYEEYTYLITVHAFCDGFSLASKILTEAFTCET